MLIHFIRRLEGRTLASQIYNEQISNKWPGLAMEVTEICERHDIEDVNEIALKEL